MAEVQTLSRPTALPLAKFGSFLVTLLPLLFPLSLS